MLSPGANGGDVSQSNEAVNTAEATNDNDTAQTVVQGQEAEATATAPEGGHHGKPGHDAAPVAEVSQVQSADVSNETVQDAAAGVANEQSNSNEATAPEHSGHGKDHGHGKDQGHGKDRGHGAHAPAAGDVSQSNKADNTATATNDNSTDQYVSQGQTALATATAPEGGDRGYDGKGHDHDGNDRDPKDHGKKQDHDAKDRDHKGGHGPKADDGKRPSHGHGGHGGHPGGVAGVDQAQSAGVSNDTTQDAVAPVTNHQQNSNGSGREDPRHGKGRHGSPSGGAEQLSSAVSSAEAANGNHTAQKVRQGQLATVLGALIR